MEIIFPLKPGPISSPSGMLSFRGLHEHGYGPEDAADVEDVLHLRLLVGVDGGRVDRDPPAGEELEQRRRKGEGRINGNVVEQH